MNPSYIPTQVRLLFESSPQLVYPPDEILKKFMNTKLFQGQRLKQKRWKRSKPKGMKNPKTSEFNFDSHGFPPRKCP